MKKLISFCLACFFGITLFAQNSVVLLVSQKNSSGNYLDSDEQLYARSAMQTFIGDLTLVNEITVRTDSNDSNLRQIQKKSQIEAAKGLGTEKSAYASDAGVKADLNIDFSLVRYNQGYKLEYSISEIETLKILSSGSSNYFQLESIDEETDRLSYSVLNDLSNHEYIMPVSFNVKIQLLHESDTEENFKKYIAEYEQKSTALQKQLEELQKENLNAEERLKTESEERALRLKIEMAERKKSMLEANEKRRIAEQEQLKKRQQELNELTEKQRNDFEKRLLDLENKRAEVIKESAKSLSLRKRIELVEADRENLNSIKKQIELSVQESNSYYENEKQKEIAAKNNEPWRKADLSDGKPTDEAKEFRKNEIEQIIKKWNERKITAENEIRSGVKEQLDSYEKAFRHSLSELENSEFTFTTISKNENYVLLNIDEYDASQKNWTVHTSTDFSDIPLLKTPYNVLPDIQISYEDMTGDKVPSGKDKEKYNEYRDNVEWADLYFRAAVPYVYATISLKVKYDEKQNIYNANYTNFKIIKTETSQVIYKSGKNLLQSSAEGKHFLQNQKSRRGIYIDGIYGNSFLYDWQAGTRLSGFWGNNFWFAGGGINVLWSDYSENYSLNFDKSMMFDILALGGVCVTIFRFRPYIEAGAGLYFSKADLNEGAEGVALPYGFSASLGGGLDYFVTNNITVGAFYSTGYRYGCGFSDNYGLRAGLNF